MLSIIVFIPLLQLIVQNCINCRNKGRGNIDQELKFYDLLLCFLFLFSEASLKVLNKRFHHLGEAMFLKKFVDKKFSKLGQRVLKFSDQARI